MNGSRRCFLDTTGEHTRLATSDDKVVAGWTSVGAFVWWCCRRTRLSGRRRGQLSEDSSRVPRFSRRTEGLRRPSGEQAEPPQQHGYDRGMFEHSNSQTLNSQLIRSGS